ncbi:hypothetical protein JG663_18315, partial [Vibrio cholerae]|uniref:hypothetical protein n=1 Tax=Vibrio cholerae TaxID=666 RepID=UPI0018F0D4D5
ETELVTVQNSKQEKKIKTRVAHVIQAVEMEEKNSGKRKLGVEYSPSLKVLLGGLATQQMLPKKKQVESWICS